MKLIIDNLVSSFCIDYLTDTLIKLGLPDAKASLGQIDFPTPPSERQIAAIERQLKLAALDTYHLRKFRVRLVLQQVKASVTAENPNRFKTTPRVRCEFMRHRTKHLGQAMGSLRAAIAWRFSPAQVMRMRIA
jgi:hypothetical protein